jgi:GNAT superfamily N-acetyltransferase
MTHIEHTTPANFAQHIWWLRRLFEQFMLDRNDAYPAVTPDDPDNFVRACHRAVFLAPTTTAIFVARVGRAVVGFLTIDICERDVGFPSRIARGLHLFVTARHRDRGVAAQLMDAGMAWIAQHDCHVIEIVAQERASWWEARGFVPVGTMMMAPLEAVVARPRANGHATTQEGTSYGHNE